MASLTVRELIEKLQQFDPYDKVELVHTIDNSCLSIKNRMVDPLLATFPLEQPRYEDAPPEENWWNK